jgi:hypothetical protein
MMDQQEDEDNVVAVRVKPQRRMITVAADDTLRAREKSEIRCGSEPDNRGDFIVVTS